MKRLPFFVTLTMAALSLTAAMPAAAAQKKRVAPPAAPARQEAPAAQPLGRADAWSAYVSQDRSGKVCYLVGQPKKSEPPGQARKQPVVMVTHRPVEKIANVVSFVEGTPLKEGVDATLDVDGTKFELFTKDDSAWARTAELDSTIVSALARARQAVIHAVPQKGPPAADVYELSGFAKALALIDKACGVPRDEKPGKKPAPHARKKAR